MKKALISMSVATLLAATSIPAQAQENMIYVAVEPCRLADTREEFGGSGVIPANTSRDFLVSGADLSSQGGASCVHPRAGAGVDPLAISAYIVAIPTATSGSGLLTAFPADQTDPDDSIATVNYAAGQVIGNTTNATLCENTAGCPDGPLGIITHNTEQDVVVDVQGYFYPATGTCPADMVAAGSICMDKYEASLWDAATGGNPIAAATACAADGSDCSKDSTAGTGTPIYAQSKATVTPTSQISWYQAGQACANVGKRLPTTAEWQMAASGTPAGANPVPADSCNATTVGAVAVTGASATGAIPCVSSAGAFDMVGNLWEWTAELTGFPSASGSFEFAITDNGDARILGGSYNSGTSNSTQDLATVRAGPSLANNGEIGFRCVR